MKTTIFLFLMSLFYLSLTGLSTSTVHEYNNGKDSITESRTMRGFSVKADTLDKRLDDIVVKKVTEMNCLIKQHEQRGCALKRNQTRHHTKRYGKLNSNSRMNTATCSQVWAN